MKKFIVNLFSNHFGIILVAINLCYFASKGQSLLNYPSGVWFMCANLPAGIATSLSVKFIEIFLLTPATILVNAILVFFITMQWLFIAWFAKLIAGKISRSKLPENHEIFR